MVSSELPEIIAVADRIIVLSEGKQTAEFTRSQANEELIMNAAIPKSFGPRRIAESIEVTDVRIEGS